MTTKTEGFLLQANWRAQAAALAEAIKAEPVYKNWVQAREDLEDRHAAQVMLRDLQQAQVELMQKAERGEAIGEEEQARWQRTVETVAYNPYVAAVLQAEAAMGELLAQINEELAKQLGLAPDGEQLDGGTGAGSSGTGDSPGTEPKSRLWVPGRP